MVRSAIICLVGCVLLAAMMPTKTPYYNSIHFAIFNPTAVIYTLASHVWVHGIRGSHIINPLPPATGEHKLAIVTGSNTGIGYETARALVVDYGWEVVLACRSKDKAIRAMLSINEEAKSGGKAVVLEQPLDLSNFESVEKFADAVKSQYEYKNIDVLINNAGRNTSGKSQNGLDLMFQSNFLGHFCLTQKLTEKLKGGRIVNLSSVMHHFATNKPKTVEFWKSLAMYNATPPPEGYSASKLGAILFSSELNRRYGASHNIHSLAVNPGGSSTDIWRDFPPFLVFLMGLVYLSPIQASAPSIAAAVQEDWGDTIYLQPHWLPDESVTPFPPFEMLAPYVGYMSTKPRLPEDGGMEAGKALWDVSEELTGCYFP
jgi:NAD(P)-dependent dehydrogenase (short-subunit alcohol dehydrogenase family)